MAGINWWYITAAGWMVMGLMQWVKTGIFDKDYLVLGYVCWLMGDRQREAERGKGGDG